MSPEARLAEAIRQPETTGVVLRRATIDTVNHVDGYWTADITLSGATLANIPMTTACLGAMPGDRCLVESYGNLPVITGILAQPGVRKLTRVSSLQWKVPYSSNTVRLCRSGNTVILTGPLQFAASGDLADKKMTETIPSGYRPAVDNAVILGGAKTAVDFFVKTDGSVYARGNTNTAKTTVSGSWITLDPLPD